MKIVKISLTLDKVNTFVNTLAKFDSNFDLICGRSVVDAKSPVGILTLDLSKPLDLHIHSDGTELSDILKNLQPYLV